MVKPGAAMNEADVELARARQDLKIGEGLGPKNYATAQLYFERAQAEADTAQALAQAAISEQRAESAEENGHEPSTDQ